MKPLALVAALSLSLPPLFAADQPDLKLELAGPAAQDLGVPFNLYVRLTNFGTAAAHDVNVAVDFRTDVGVGALSPACSSPSAGSIVCHLDSVPTGAASFTQLQLTLVAPTERHDGSIVFFGRATESETDRGPSSNDTTSTVPLYQTLYVTTTADDGAGSLRQAIRDANSGGCLGQTPCTIAFRIDEPSANPWKTIRLASPLPPLTVENMRIDGTSQTGFFGDTNPDGPEIEISGGGTVAGDGLTVTSCNQQVGNLAIDGFLGNGVSVIEPRTPCSSFTASTTLHHLFVGTDPTGSTARPNGRGIGTSVSNLLGTGKGGGLPTSITDSVISGNTHSGIFGLSGQLFVLRNRIGVKAHGDLPLPNGNSGVYVGPGGYGSEIGSESLGGNLIAFNGQMGVAVAAGVEQVSIRDDRIWGNGGLAIDIGLDGPSPSAPVPPPVLTLAHYDPAADQTVIEGDVAQPSIRSLTEHIDVYASDAPALSGAGEMQRFLGVIHINAGHFRFTTPGNLTGQFITATHTSLYPTGFATVGEGTGLGELTQTSEVSAPLKVQ